MSNPKRYREKLQDEWNGAALYAAMAELEKDERLSTVYRRLADVERRHSETWARKLRECGADVPKMRLAWRTRTLIWLARKFGVKGVLPMVLSLEKNDSDDYISDQTKEGSRMAADERSHARVLRQIRRVSPDGAEGNFVARAEGRHRPAGGNALRAAVLGGNDGLVSNLSLVMGVAGAEIASRGILITGIAGLLAGASSMALGEWLSVQSSRELYENQIATEEEEIADAPEEEAEELALIYQARGLDEQSARDMATQIMSDPKSALDTLAREELGVDPNELGGSPWEAAIFSFILFATGAIIPVLPFIFLDGNRAIVTSLVASAIGLFVIGAAITLFTGRNLFYSGFRQVLFGLIAAALTFGIGRLIGVSMS